MVSHVTNESTFSSLTTLLRKKICTCESSLYDLKNDENIEIKSADKSAVVVVSVREDYIIEATR